MNRTLTYQVDKITVVLPEDSQHLLVEDGQDYCTLMTCTPYGVNSHRLLVSGTRVEDKAPKAEQIAQETEHKITDFTIVAMLVAVPILLLLLIYLLIRNHRKKE